MQNADQYRQFAESLAAAAETAAPETRELLLGAARAWRNLADAEEGRASHGNVIDFAHVRSLRSA
jgi:hypothetical protein